MRRKKQEKKKRILIGSIVVLVVGGLFLFIFYRQDKNYSMVGQWMKEVGVGITRMFSIPVQQVLLPSPNELDLSLSKAKDQEIEELKKLLEIKSTYTQFQVITALTIERNTDYFKEGLTINKGEKDGIQKDMAVITPYGLIGKISKVGQTFSEVRLLSSLSEPIQVSVQVNSQEETYHGVLSGYDEKKGLFRVSGIASQSTIQIGDKITTSGLGGIFPEGIYVGEVVEVTQDEFGITKTLYLASGQDFNQINYVSVLVRGVES